MSFYTPSRRESGRVMALHKKILILEGKSFLLPVPSVTVDVDDWIEVPKDCISLVIEIQNDFVGLLLPDGSVGWIGSDWLLTMREKEFIRIVND